jgi:hypothetical protein
MIAYSLILKCVVMKKISQLYINLENLMNDNEMLALKGGDYTPGILVCSGGEYGPCTFEVPGCRGAAESYCNLCPGGWTTSVCVGG